MSLYSNYQLALLLLLDYSLSLFSRASREFLFLMAGERKIQTPASKKAPVNNKFCKFVKVIPMSLCLIPLLLLPPPPALLSFHFSTFPYFLLQRVWLHVTFANLAIKGCTQVRRLWRGAEQNVLWVGSVERLAQSCAVASLT